MVTHSVELLAPAGSPEALDAAVAEGADGVYLGLKAFNARMRSANFAYSQFEGALRSLHRMGRRLYVTVNTVFEQREADRMYQLLKYLAALGPDGIIVQDFGILMMAREFPGLKLHASTQMNIASARGANALSAYGVSRAVLARELSLDEIKSIRQGTNLELEVFVHGALCVSASGLCLFSSYLGGKSANRGLCTQACRRLYRAENSSTSGLRSTGTGDAAYYFSPCDLSLIGRAADLAEAGVRSFKIEGRMKSAEYVGTVVSACRLVIDSLEGSEDQQRQALEEAQRILQNDFARPKTEFFFAAPDAGPDWLRPDQDGGTGISLGAILRVKGAGTERRALIAGGFALSPGDSVRFHRADDSQRKAHKLTHAEPVRDGVLVSVPEGFGAGDSAYLIQTRAMTKRYPQVIPRDLSPFKRQPGRERAPGHPLAETAAALCGTGQRKTKAGQHKTGQCKAGQYKTGPGKQAKQTAREFSPGQKLPEGIFAAAAQTEDLYIIQSSRPAGVILPVNPKTARALLSETLPFRAGEIILNLNPYFPQAEETFLADALPKLRERGYDSFIVNNPGHFSFFPKSKPALLIAGPWLYTFNAWSAAFAASLGASAFITPLENNRQNLERTMPREIRPRVFVTLFAWPPLFRIRADLGARYRFKRFSGSRDESFSIVNGDETVVIPGTPFSITDKRPFLEEAGFRRFILDFSAGTFNGSFPVKKKFYKEAVKAAREGLPLSGKGSGTEQAGPDFSRFNWKDGFFSEKNKNSAV